MTRRLVWLALVTLVACYSPPKPACGFLCGPEGACPTDYTCASDGRCHVDGSPEDLACDDLPDAQPLDAIATDAPRDAAVDAP